MSVSAAFVACFAAACAGGAEEPTTPGTTTTADAGKDGEEGTTSFGDGGDQPAPADGCVDSTRLVYTLDADQMLRTFDPPSATFTTIGKLDCPTYAGTNSMAVDRSGNAWVLYDDGELFKVSTKDASCASTTFAPGQAGIWTFGMGFATNVADGDAETLYIAGYPPEPKLATLSLATMKVDVVGDLDRPARAELSGTGSGQMFALFDATSPDEEGQGGGLPFAVAELDKSSGKILSLAEQMTLPQESLNFAFAAWGGEFYLFVFTSVYRYQPSTKKATKIADTDFLVVGAGVSTCAPHAIVK